MNWDIALGAAKVLGGLFGKKQKAPSPRDNMMSQAQGAREAAAKYGFNPLTMLQYGNPGGSLSSGGPALASTDMIIGGLTDVADVLTGRTAQENAARELDYDLKKIALEEARSQVKAVGGGSMPLGGRPTTIAQPTIKKREPLFPAFLGTPGGLKYGANPSQVAGDGRKVEVEPEKNISGTTVVENSVTGGPITLPDSELVEEWMMNGLIGSPQVAYNHGRNAGNYTSKNWYGGGNAFTAARDKAEKVRKGPVGMVWNPNKGGWVRK